MDRGMVNGFGSHDQLLENNQIYGEMFRSQMSGVAQETGERSDEPLEKSLEKVSK